MDIALDGLFSMLWADPATFVVIIAAIFFFGFFSELARNSPEK